MVATSGRVLGAILAATVLVSGAVWANNDVSTSSAPTFYKDVLPILQENCQLCHRDKGANFGGMVAPMALMEFEQVRPWAKGIAQQVSSKRMPPWKADPRHSGVFANERTLTHAEIETLVSWANAGARPGNPNDAPPPNEWPETNGWMIGEPDIIVKMPERYFVEDDVEDLYIDFHTTIGDDQLPEDRWIKAVEFRGGSQAVHHIIARPLGGMAPGYDPVRYREGFGALLKKGSTIRWNMHYHKEKGPGTGVWDQSEAGVIFWPKGTVIKHRVEVESLGRHDFLIPAGDPNYTFDTTFEMPYDSYIISFNPHMHLRGKSAFYKAIYPDGKEEVLLDVPEYDFNWQITYSYKEPKLIPKGTQIYYKTAWDNSADNPTNPDPTEDVRWGRPTTAEMMYGWMRYTKVEPVNIVVGEESPEDLVENDFEEGD